MSFFVCFIVLVIVRHFGFADTVPAGSEGWQSPLVHTARAYACNHFQYVAASWLLQKMLLTLLDAVRVAGHAGERERMDRFVCAFAGMNKQMGYGKNRGIF